MTDLPILSLLIFLPLLGAGLTALLRADARLVALYTTILVALISLVLPIQFDAGKTTYQFLETVVWAESLGLGYRVGVDGISMPFVLLTTWLMPLVILASWRVKERIRDYMIAFLILEAMMVGTFAALDAILFYVFFEGVLIPMFLIIGIWGGARRVYASIKFVLYTLAGSVLMLIALIALVLAGGTSDMTLLSNIELSSSVQTWLFFGFFASFAVKMPMWPVHTWLPDAHVEAPTAGSVILAGVLLKLGGYGFLRFSLDILPDASATFAPLVLGLSAIAVVYTSLVAFAQTDIKKLIAYSSVAHMGYVTLGIFAGSTQGITGALFQMISHGIVSAALFLCVGVIYDRAHTREIAKFGGLASAMPRYATILLLFTMASVGLPGTSGFIGEFLSLAGAMQASTWATAVSALGMIFGAVYMLHLYRRLCYGEPKKGMDAEHMPDLSGRELATLVPLAAATLWLGFFPQPLLKVFEGPAEILAAEQHKAREGTQVGRPIITAAPASVPGAEPKTETKAPHGGGH